MRKLKLVQQYDQTGCVPACLGMIVDKSYFEIRQLLIDSKIQKHRSIIGIYEWELQEILSKYFGINSRWIKFENLSKLENHCILFLAHVYPPQTLQRHCVVYDAKECQILDPDMSLYNNLGGFNVSNCLEIYEKIS